MSLGVANERNLCSGGNLLEDVVFGWMGDNVGRWIFLDGFVLSCKLALCQSVATWRQ